MSEENTFEIGDKVRHVTSKEKGVITKVMKEGYLYKLSLGFLVDEPDVFHVELESCND